MNHLQGFGLFFLIGGAVGACGGVERVLRKRAQARRAVAVTARIVVVESDGGVEPGELTHYYPVVTFTVDGKAVRVKLLRPSARPGEYQSGTTIRAYYDPRDPTQVVARPRDFPGGGLAAVLGAVFAAIGAGLCWVGWNSR